MKLTIKDGNSVYCGSEAHGGTGVKREHVTLRTCHANIITSRHAAIITLTIMPDNVLPHALQVPAIKKLKGKRIVLASNSPRRKEILRTLVRDLSLLVQNELIQPTHVVAAKEI